MSDDKTNNDAAENKDGGKVEESSSGGRDNRGGGSRGGGGGRNDDRRGGGRDDRGGGGRRFSRGGGGGGRRFRRRRGCPFLVKGKCKIDYKDVDNLRQYLTETGKIRPRRQTSACSKCQRELARAIKRARHLALLPYAPEHIRSSYQ